jgi:hypothetical protein
MRLRPTTLPAADEFTLLDSNRTNRAALGTAYADGIYDNTVPEPNGEALCAGIIAILLLHRTTQPTRLLARGSD